MVGLGDITTQISIRGREKENAYAAAMRQGHIDVIELLIKLDGGAAAADGPEESLRTPLSLANQLRFRGSVNLFIQCFSLHLEKVS